MHKLPQLPEPAYPFGTKGMLCENAFDADQVRTYALTYGQQCAQAQGEAQAAENRRLRELLSQASDHILSISNGMESIGGDLLGVDMREAERAVDAAYDWLAALKSEAA